MTGGSPFPAARRLSKTRTRHRQVMNQDQTNQISSVASKSSSILADHHSNQVSPSAPVEPFAVGRDTSTQASNTAQKKASANDLGVVGTQQTASMTAFCHWCATVSVLLILQYIAGSLFHHFHHTPGPAEGLALLLLLGFVVFAVTIRFYPSAKPFAAYVLALGSLLMTCQIEWHWAGHAARFRASVPLEQTLRQDQGMHNATTAAFLFGDPWPPASLYGAVFGTSGLDILDTATLFVILFLNAVQSSFLCRLGLRITAPVSVLQLLVFACWPFTFPQSNPAWVCRAFGAVLWTVHLIHTSYLWESERKQYTQLIGDLQETVAHCQQELQDGQKADSVLNHLLKNTMADASATIDVCRDKYPCDSNLVQASDILFRGMSWCKWREAMLKLVAGRYETVRSSVAIQEFAKDFVRGRAVALEPLEDLPAVHLDPMVCNIVLDNAVTNATRHGCPGDPQVKLAADVSEPISDDDSIALHALCNISDTSDASRTPRKSIKVRFLLTNRANPARPLQTRWSSLHASDSLPTDSSRPALSDGLGLRHISMAANSCGLTAELWQEGEGVFFALSFLTTSASSPRTSFVQPVHQGLPFPPHLNILFLDDSDIAQRTVQTNFRKMAPACEVAVFGKDAAEVEDFQRTALAKGDILIMDQNIDVPGKSFLGTDILKDLVEAGYRGFVCIRSGDSTDDVKALALESGAHWYVGKEVPIRQMISSLRLQYEEFLKNAPPASQTHEFLPRNSDSPTKEASRSCNFNERPTLRMQAASSSLWTNSEPDAESHRGSMETGSEAGTRAHRTFFRAFNASNVWGSEASEGFDGVPCIPVPPCAPVGTTRSRSGDDCTPRSMDTWSEEAGRNAEECPSVNKDIDICPNKQHPPHDP